MKHLLHFLSQEDAEQAGSYIYEKLRSNVVVEKGKVTFCTSHWLGHVDQVVLLNHVKSYEPLFNIQEGVL